MTIVKTLAGVAGLATAAGAWAWMRSRRQDAAGDDSPATEFHGPKELSREAREALDRAIAKVVKKEFKRLCRKLPPDVTPGSRLGPATRALRAGKQPEYDEWECLYYMVRFFPRQVNLAYSILSAKYPDGIKGSFRMVDLGCGPWAAQFAVAVLAAQGAAGSSRRARKPDVAVAGIDPSDAMLSFGKKVWRAWRREVTAPALSQAIEVLTQSSETFSKRSHFKRSEWLRKHLSVRRGCARRSFLGQRLRRERFLRFLPTFGRLRKEAPKETDWWITAFHAVYGGNARKVGRGLDDCVRVCKEHGYEPRLAATTNRSKKKLLEGLRDGPAKCSCEQGLCWYGPLECTTKRKLRMAECCGLAANERRELRWKVRWESLKGDDVLVTD